MHKSTKNIQPSEQVTKRLKNKGKIRLKRLPTKLQSAITGIEIIVNLAKYFPIFRLGQTLFLIIFIFNIADVVKQPPIA